MRNFKIIAALLLLVFSSVLAEQFTVTYGRTCLNYTKPTDKKDWCNEDLPHTMTFNIGARGDILETPVGTPNNLSNRPTLFSVTGKLPNFIDAFDREYQAVSAVDGSGNAVTIRVQTDNSAVVVVYPTFIIVYDKAR